MLDVAALPPATRALLSDDRLFDLGPGRPNEAVRVQLQALTADGLFAPAKVRRPDFAQACMAGLWLYHDFLDESHTLSQDLSTVEGSYWHGIMHRREPDYDNAKYWFRRVGSHPVFEPLRQRAAKLADAAGGEFLRTQAAWDPYAFIDLCEAAERGRGPEALCRQVQRVEWTLLFAYCYHQALGQE